MKRCVYVVVLQILFFIIALFFFNGWGWEERVGNVMIYMPTLHILDIYVTGSEKRAISSKTETRTENSYIGHES